MLHTTSSGRIEPCKATVRACPLAPPEDHYRTIKAASRALIFEALERQTDFDLAPLPDGWGSTAHNAHLDELLRAEEPEEPRVAPVAQSGGLTAAAFIEFAASEAARRAPVDRGDWRTRQLTQAELNGDLDADANPDTSLVFGGYYDPTPDEDDDLWNFEDKEYGNDHD